MKKLLKSIVNFMERKWPDQVVLNVDQFNKLLKRIEALEAENNKFNVSLGFGGTVDRQARQPFQR